MLKNTDKSWGFGSKLLHWLVFVVFAGLIVIGEIMTDLGKTESILGIGKYTLYDYHKTIGFILLFIVFIRIFWRLFNVVPEVVPMPKKEKLLVKTMHYLLYIAMLIMPISGYVMSMAGGYGIKIFGSANYSVPNIIGEDKALSHIAHEIHVYSILVIYVLLAMHILAALLHHFVKKDNVLKSMLFKCKK